MDCAGSAFCYLPPAIFPSMSFKGSFLVFHARTHAGLTRYLGHCRALTDNQFTQELDGFGIPSLQQQFNHVIGAENYWITVIRVEYRHEDYVPSSEREHPTIDSLVAWQEEVASRTRELIGRANDEWLTTPAPFMAWPGEERMLQPQHVLMRVITHNFQHRGQIAAMCRLQGHPVPQGLDFPLD